MHISNLEYETTTFNRKVGHHSLSGAKPHSVLDENSHTPTISNRPFIWKCVTVHPLCAQYVEHCSLSQVWWCDIFQVGFLSIPSRLVVTEMTNFTIFKIVRVLAKCTYYVHNALLFIRLCVSPSVCVYKHGSHWTNLRQIWYWGLLWNSVLKFQILLKSARSVGRCTWRPKYASLLPGT